jgi:hypothetical protein
MVNPRPDFRVRIYRQGIKYLYETGWQPMAAIMLGHICEKDYETIREDFEIYRGKHITIDISDE